MKRVSNYPLVSVPKSDTGALAEKAKAVKQPRLGNSASWSRIFGRRDACTLCNGEVQVAVTRGARLFNKNIADC